MDIYVYDSNYNRVAVIDTFTSLIWTKRYYECGDFELYIPADSAILPYIQPDYFLMRDDDESVMVIEKFECDTDAENGDFFIVSGRCLKSILLRRIFSRQYVLNNSGTINAAAQAMISECTTVHTPIPHYPNDYRQISGLTVDFSTTFDAALQTQFTGQTLLDGIISIAQPREIGLKMTISGTNLVVSFFKGQDNGVIFSPDFDNLVNSKYVFDKSSYANRAYIAGEGQGSSRIWTSVTTGTLINPYSGLGLHEIYVDARDVSSNDGGIDYVDYLDMLSSRGWKKLSESEVSKAFDATVETKSGFIYKQDYDLGDVVTVTNEYGITAKPRIVEIVESWDETGYTVIPKFDALEV